MLFLPPPALFQLPGSPFSLPKSRISPLFLSAALHGMLPASGPGRKSPPTSPSPANTRTSLAFFPILRLFRPSLFLILFLLYIYIQAAEAEQPNGCPAKQPGQGGTPLPFRHFPDKQKSDGFPRFFRKRKTPAGRPLYQSIRVSENVSGNPLLYKSFFLCLPVHGGSVRFGKLCLFPEEVSAAPSAAENFPAEKNSLQKRGFRRAGIRA